LDTDDKFEHTYASEGDFSYFCTVHPFMTGVVHVRSNSLSSSALGVQCHIEFHSCPPD
jgi:hypothetical protein